MQIKKDYTREQIVVVARGIFLKKGYAKTSMRDIAAGVGIGVSNIYNYFKSKDELFRYIVTPLTAELERMMREHHNVKDQEDFLCYATGQSNMMLGDNVKEYMLLIRGHQGQASVLLLNHFLKGREESR